MLMNCEGLFLCHLWGQPQCHITALGTETTKVVELMNGAISS
jgi:hypothetical protein